MVRPRLAPPQAPRAPLGPQNKKKGFNKEILLRPSTRRRSWKYKRMKAESSVSGSDSGSYGSSDSCSDSDSGSDSDDSISSGIEPTAPIGAVDWLRRIIRAEIGAYGSLGPISVLQARSETIPRAPGMVTDVLNFRRSSPGGSESRSVSSTRSRASSRLPPSARARRARW